MTPRRFLFLGGPFGGFFAQLAKVLAARDARIFRIHLHGADAVNWGFRPGRRFNRPYTEWPDFVRHYMREKGITDLLVYGDCQFYNRAALEAARALGLRCHILEHGYFRPDWVTYERNGVNGYSSLPRDPQIVKEQAAACPPPLPPRKIGRITPYHVFHTVMDWIYDILGWPFFLSYHFPYSHRPPRQAVGTLRRFLGLQLRPGAQARRRAEIRRDPSPYFLCLLQREGDSQILFHSGFPSVLAFVAHVLENFADHAPPDVRLVFKNHPLDPGIVNYARAIARLAQKHGVGDRVFFLDGGSLAELAKPARGVVTVNSTAGISAVQFDVPTIALGDAIYAMKGLVYQGSLADFWHAPERPDAELFHSFHRLVLARTQINGNFYAPLGQRILLPVLADRLLQD